MLLVNKKILRDNLCRNFCSYYKPLKAEGLACRGFILIEKLINGGKKITFRKFDGKISGETEKMLSHNMCRRCSFFDNGCDFAEQKEGALPCGGFILLGHMLEADTITIDDITAKE